MQNNLFWTNLNLLRVATYWVKKPSPSQPEFMDQSYKMLINYFLGSGNLIDSWAALL